MYDARVCPDLLKALAILFDTTVIRSPFDKEDLEQLKIRKKVTFLKLISKFYICKFFKALQDAQRLIKMVLICITLFSNIFGIGREIIVNELTAR